ncbi:MAG: bifunctional methylenetetrahydrofolate dehydrogenase/methenyltetrahydrofolate cyclohydrolase FolD [Candidatus Eremiobacterota bacterium]
MTKILYGKPIANKITEEIKEKTTDFVKKTGIKPCLAVILAGNNPASRVYVDRKKKACAKAGMDSREFLFPEDCNEEDLLKTIEDLNRDEKIHGILVQLPLPSHISEEKIIEAVNPLKDVDCLHPINTGKLFSENPVVFPCTPYGIYIMLKESGIEVTGKHVVIIGRSKIVGKPMADILLRKEIGATVTVCHSKTKNLEHHTLQADIIIAAIGKPEFIKASMVKEGAAVVDVGINRLPDSNTKSGTRLVGDVAFEEVSKKASAITPVPGGVGPMTIAMLLRNTISAAEKIVS